MARILIVHPSAHQREILRHPLLDDGWAVTESPSRADALQRLAGPTGQRFGDLVLIDLADWSVPGTALIRSIRRQLASPLPILVRLPQARDAADLAAHAARVAGANLLLPHDAPPEAVVRAAASLSGRAPVLSRVQLGALLIRSWQEQLELLAMPDHAAATVVSARRVFEALLAQRLDERAAEAAQALTGIAGGPVPLNRWAGWYHPAHETFEGEAALSQRRQQSWPLCLLFDAGGQRYALALDADVAPGCWWSDNGPLPESTDTTQPALPLVRLLGSSGFRRLLCTDRASVLLRRSENGRTQEHTLRVDEVMGIEPLEIEPCPTWAARASGCLGSAVDRDGEPVLVLEGAALWRQLHAALAGVVR